MRWSSVEKSSPWSLPYPKHSRPETGFWLSAWCRTLGLGMRKAMPQHPPPQILQG